MSLSNVLLKRFDRFKDPVELYNLRLLRAEETFSDKGTRLLGLLVTACIQYLSPVNILMHVKCQS